MAQKKKLTALSECIYLNGLWAVQGVQNIEQAPEPGKWFYAPLPMGMSWATPVFRPESAESRQKVEADGKDEQYGCRSRKPIEPPPGRFPDFAHQARLLALLEPAEIGRRICLPQQGNGFQQFHVLRVAQPCIYARLVRLFAVGKERQGKFYVVKFVLHRFSNLHLIHAPPENG